MKNINKFELLLGIISIIFKSSNNNQYHIYAFLTENIMIVLTISLFSLPLFTLFLLNINSSRYFLFYKKINKYFNISMLFFFFFLFLGLVGIFSAIFSDITNDRIYIHYIQIALAVSSYIKNLIELFYLKKK